MKNLIIIAALLLLTFSLPAQGADRPDYLTVADTFLARYLPDLGANGYVRFLRKPEGYYAQEAVHGQTVVGPSRLFYLFEGEKYLDLPYARRGPEEAGHYLTEDYALRAAGQFERHYYYGYPGFTLDVIRELEGREEKPPEVLRFLGRAYAEHAMNLLNNRYGLAKPEWQFKLDEATGERLSAIQLAEYLRYQREAIGYYQRLPADYATPVGDARTKHANEVMGTYLTLLQYADEAAARAEVKGDLYDNYLLMGARAMLESCPEGAVLLTEGDNDTYGLLYVQVREGFRADVLVLNRHLLNVPRYVELARRGYGSAQGLPAALGAERYRAWEGAYFPADRAGRPVALADVTEWLARATNGTALPFNRLVWPAGSEKEAYWNWTTPYLLAGDMWLMDALATNYFKRPFCLATTVSLGRMAETNARQRRGLVYVLEPEAVTNGMQAEFGARLLEKYLGRPDVGPPSAGAEVFYGQFRYLTVLLSDHFRERSDVVRARRVLDRFVGHRPLAEVFGEAGAYGLVDRYALLNLPDMTAMYGEMLRGTLLAKPAAERTGQEEEVLRQLEELLDK